MSCVCAHAGARINQRLELDTARDPSLKMSFDSKELYELIISQNFSSLKYASLYQWKKTSNLDEYRLINAEVCLLQCHTIWSKYNKQ